MDQRPAREFDVELPVGYLDEDSRLHRQAVLRKMTGQEEALLADRKLRKNAGKLVTELLASCLRELGEVKPVTRQVVSKLTSLDRNYLLMELRKITFGNELEANYTCPACDETNTIVEDLEELPVRRLNGEGIPEIVVQLEDCFEDRDGELYNTMVFRLPTGSDEEKTASIARENTSHGNNALLSRCLLTLGDMPQSRREALGTKIMQNLTMGDRARIDWAFRKEVPGVDLTRDITCERCGRDFHTTLDLTRFFSLQ